MADTTNRRRESKGIPTGGRFARGSSGAGDASDLTAPAEDSVLGGVDAVDRKMETCLALQRWGLAQDA